MMAGGNVMKQYVMGVDVGTTGSKAIIFDLEGNIVGKGYQEYACTYPRPNWVEQDAQMLADTTMQVCKRAVESAGVEPSKIASISVSAQRCCLLLMDAQGECLKMISWMDNRPSDEVHEVEQMMGAKAFYDVSGLPLGTTWILPKLIWVRKHEPELWAKTSKVVQLHDFILRALGADDYYSDEPDAAFWGFWDTDKLDWNQAMLQRFEIDTAMLPKIVQSGTCVGVATGLFAGVPLCVGAGDQNCAAIGAGVVTDGYASVSIGTGGLATVFLSKPFRDKLGKTMVTNSAVHGAWQMEGLQNGAAGIFRWFRDEIAALEKHLADEDGSDPFEAINALIKQSPVGAKGLVFLPYFASAASPRYNEHARGTMLGLSFLHTRGDLARAVIEGITMEQKDILSAIRATGVSIECIRIMGGATNSEIWNQVQADMYGCRVETLKVTDAAVLGAAMCAAVGVGLFDGIEQAAAALVRPAQVYQPVAEHAAHYDKQYEVYCDAYAALADGVFEKLGTLG